MINILVNIGLVIVLLTLLIFIYAVITSAVIISSFGIGASTAVLLAAASSLVYCFVIVTGRLYNGHY